MMAYITVNKGGANMKGFSNIVEKISSGGGYYPSRRSYRGKRV